MGLLLAGTSMNLTTTNETKILNVSSMNERYPRLHLLPPIDFRCIPPSNPEMAEYEFDLRYAEWLLSNEDAFIDLMQIVFPLYQGFDIFMLITEADPVLISYNESLFKFIQQRYGYNTVIVRSIEDLFNAEDYQPEGIHVSNLLNDKDRLTYIFESRRLAAGGQIPYEY